MLSEARTEDGFSLIELMVAMAITLIVSASIYGLVASGQNAFRRDPEISERQQNIRVAMERLQRDLTQAGMGLYGVTVASQTTSGYWMDIFEREGNEAGPADIDSVIHPGELTDTLTFVGDDGECESVPLSSVSGTNVNASDSAVIPNCYPEPGLVWLLWPNGIVKRAWGHNIHAQGGKLNFPSGQQPAWPISQVQAGKDDLECSAVVDHGAGESCSTPVEVPIAIVNMTMYSYRIGTDTDGIPSLFRSTTGGFYATGTGATDAAYSDPPGDGWQLLARGVTDLQVEYRTGAGWADEAPDVIENDYDTLVREVRVTIQARTTGNAQLGTDAASVIQGRLTASVTPRSALHFLASAPAPYTWR